MSLSEKVTIIGTGCCKFGENYHQSIEDMVVEAASEAYADARVDPSEVQAAWVGTMASGSAGTALADPLKLFNMPITRVENYCASGMDAFRNACMAVAAGMYDVVLALGFEKLRDSGQRGLGAAASHEHPVIGYGTTAPTLFALAATRYFKTYGIGKDALAKHLWHKAGARQVKNAEIGMAHNLGGPGAVGCVTILSN